LEQAKPFCITKRQVWEAYKRVKARKGAAGVDGQTIEAFEEDLEGNLYKLWNRLASGSYFPSPVLRVEIPKGDGRMRPLGIPTVADRVAQMVAKQFLEPELEKHFHPDSYGYRPGKSALDAVGMARKRCWKNDWVLDLDIKGFFDNIDHELMMRAVRTHTEENWVLLYIERWLKAPIEHQDGTRVLPQKGTPQGGVASPLLANLFLHYAFDKWMDREHPEIPFERYADDGVCHCKSKAQAEMLRRELIERLKEVGLGRECPELSCEVVLGEQEWKAVYIVCKKQKPPEKPPTLDTMIKMVSSFGGFLNRKSDGFPGPKTIWIGMQRCRDFALAIESHSETIAESCG